MRRLPEYTNELARYGYQRSIARAIVAMGRDTGGSPGWSERIIRELHPSDKDALAIVQRGAVVPAPTSSITQFSQTAISGIVSLLSPGSAFVEIVSRALGLSFENNGKVTVPKATASGAQVAFIAQGGPFPVQQFTFAGTDLLPQKCGMIAAFTRELINSSNAEVLVRALLQENLSLKMDTILLDATAGDTTRPAGLRNGIAATSATAGGGSAALIGDLAGLGAAVAPVANGQIVYLASPKQAIKINLMRTSQMPYPVISTPGLEDGVVAALAVNGLAIAGGNDPPKISKSDNATLHMEDTSPAAFSTVGTPNTVAAPMRSLWQTDALAIKIVADLTWALRTTGAFAWTQSVTW